MLDKNDLFYETSRLNTGMWKFFPLIFTIFLSGIGVMGLLFSDNLRDSNTGEPFPKILALIMIVIGALFYLAYRKFKNRYSYFEFYEHGFKLPNESERLIPWNEMDKVGVIPFTQPLIHYIKISGEHKSRLFAARSNFGSFADSLQNQSTITLFCKRMQKRENEE